MNAWINTTALAYTVTRFSKAWQSIFTKINRVTIHYIFSSLQQMWVFDEGVGMNCRDVTFVPGLYKIFDEILGEFSSGYTGLTALLVPRR